MPRHKTKPKAHRILKPLRLFDYKLVAGSFEGALINVDRDLQRMGNRAEQAGANDLARRIGLLNTFVRFAWNSYSAARYLIAESPEDPGRKPNYALVLAPLNRQLLDLLFSLIYMLDDFEARSLQYQRAGWREAAEEYQHFKNTFSRNHAWQRFFTNYRIELDRLVPVLGITIDERRKPQSIPYWKHPFKLANESSKSSAFLTWLEKWMYGDTSAQAHLSFGGLLKVSPFLIAELVSEGTKQLVEGRVLKQYVFQQFSRTGIVTLAIATEANHQCHLNNNGQLDYVWSIFNDYVEEAKEMYERRYKALLH